MTVPAARHHMAQAVDAPRRVDHRAVRHGEHLARGADGGRAAPAPGRARPQAEGAALGVAAARRRQAFPAPGRSPLRPPRDRARSDAANSWTRRQEGRGDAQRVQQRRATSRVPRRSNSSVAEASDTSVAYWPVRRSAGSPWAGACARVGHRPPARAACTQSTLAAVKLVLAPVAGDGDQCLRGAPVRAIWPPGLPCGRRTRSGMGAGPRLRCRGRPPRASARTGRWQRCCADHAAGREEIAAGRRQRGPPVRRSCSAQPGRGIARERARPLRDGGARRVDHL